MKEINQYLVKGLTHKPLNSVKAIVVHWFADPMAKATNVIKWWESQADGVAAHDVIDLNGDLYHAVPYSMMAYQVGCPRGYTKEALARLSSYPNNCVVGIECAHLDMIGKMTPETYNTLVQQTAKLVKQFNLTINDVWLHSEIVGKDYKDCHRWFTTTKPEDWVKFKNEVDAILHPPVKPAVSPQVMGVITVQAKDGLRVHSQPDVNSPTVQPSLKDGSQWKVYSLVKGWYNVGSGWVSGNYVKFVPSK